MPKVFQQLALGYWRLSERLALTWWRALLKSQWSRPRELRQSWLLYEGSGLGGVSVFIFKTSSPHVVIPAIEDQVLEGLLSRKDANRLQDCILKRVNAAGTWC